MKVDAARVNDQLQQLGQFGFTEGSGVTRPALSEAHLQARRWLKEQMRDIGLDVRMDAAGNVIGRLKASAGVRQPQTVIVGSHLDTVPQGGKFDGALGVVAGLECARLLKENRVDLPWNLEVVDFTDEEGYHFAGTFGSRAMMGMVSEQELHRTRTEDVPTLAERFSQLGWDTHKLPEAERSPEDLRAYFELHIEQGNRMEKRELDIAAVTGIVGIYRYTVQVLGTANHAGTTTMADRDDALVTAAELLQLLPEWARARSPDMVATCGQLSVQPGAQNIIPGKCRFSVELRSLESEDMQRVRDRLTAWLKENCRHSLSNVLEKDGVRLDQELIELILQQAEASGLQAVPLASGAGHDAQSFAPFVPTGMIFVPSAGGISHSPEEYSKPEWVANGVQVLTQTVHELARCDTSG